jgi:hypothetical protein
MWRNTFLLAESERYRKEKIVDAVPLRNDEQRIVQRVLGQYDAPAFIRRARRVQEALDLVLARCRQQRDEWLMMPRLRLGMLRALAGDWHRLQTWLADVDQIVLLQDLEKELTPRLRVRIEPTSSKRGLGRALISLQESLEIFNRRWLDFLPTVDLTPVNEAREGYNRYYLLEKECAVRSPRLARQGFQHLKPMTTEELQTRLPLLPIPRLVSD